MGLASAPSFGPLPAALPPLRSPLAGWLCKRGAGASRLSTRVQARAGGWQARGHVASCWRPASQAKASLALSQGGGGGGGGGRLPGGGGGGGGGGGDLPHTHALEPLEPLEPARLAAFLSFLAAFLEA